METHHHHHHHHHLPETQKNITIAFLLNAAFTVIEIIGGILTNSVAILTDAVHDLGDTFSLALAWYTERLAQRKPDGRFTYGYKRFPVLAAMVNAVFLLGASIFVLSRAIPLLLKPEQVHASGMIWLAIAGLIFNGAAVLKLSKGESINQRVVKLHLLEDVLGWAAVLIGAIVIRFTNWLWIDPLLAILIALYIIYNAVKNIAYALRIFLQASPGETDMPGLKEKLMDIPGINDLHDIRTWSIDGQTHVYTMHVVAAKGTGPDQYPELKKQIRSILADAGFEFVTVEIDSFDEHCELNEYQQ